MIYLGIGIVIFALYIGWINSSIREVKSKLSNIEDMLKDKAGFDKIFVICDRLSKGLITIPCKKNTDTF